MTKRAGYPPLEHSGMNLLRKDGTPVGQYDLCEVDGHGECYVLSCEAPRASMPEGVLYVKSCLDNNIGDGMPVLATTLGLHWARAKKDEDRRNKTPLTVTDAMVDAAYNTRIPGGSQTSWWFQPHDSERARANIRDVLRCAITAALDQSAKGVAQDRAAAEAGKLLAEGIRAAAIRAGICNDDEPLDGPQLLLLVSDLANEVISQREALQGAQADTTRIDFLEKQGNGSPWVARKSQRGKGYRLHNDAEGTAGTARGALDEAIKAEA